MLDKTRQEKTGDVSARRPLRVLHVCESLPGGPASYLNEVIPYQMAAFGAGNIGAVVPETQKQAVSVIGDIRAYTYDRNGRSPRDLARLFVALRHACRDFRPDVLHLHGTFAGLVGRLVKIAGGTRAPVLYCAHGWAVDPDRPSRARILFGCIESALSRVTTRIINISPHEEVFLRRWGISGPRCKLIVSGIADLPESAVLAEPEAAMDGPLQLLFVGRTDPQKGFDLLRAEFTHAPDIDFRLRVAGASVVSRGDGVAGEEDPRVSFLGWVDRNTLPALLAASDALIMPSRWEGLPLAALEALRSGRALITSHRGPFPFMVRDGLNGLMMNIDEPGFFARTLNGVDRAALRRMGRQARLDFETRYRSERMNEELVALYAEVAGEGTERSPPA